MPRPTPAQFAYGSVTVVCSTLAMLLLSQSPAGPEIAVIAVVALVLGLLVALTAAPGTHPARRTAGRRTASRPTGTCRTGTRRAAAGAAGSRIHARHDAASTPAATGQSGQSGHRRVAEPSLRP